jgi:putative transposase
VYHVLNRSAARHKMFKSPGDYEAFERIVVQAHQRVPIEIYSYCILSNHWHFVVRPPRDGQLSEFFRWLAHTHAMRWRVAHRTVGYGPLYQGRFKSFAVQEDEHFLTVCRYVERNALSAGVVEHAEDWPHGSLWARRHGSKELRGVLSDWPVDRPRDWIWHVNEPITTREMQRLKPSLDRGRPFGEDRWLDRTVQRLHLEHTIRKEGRPKRQQRREN